MKIKEKLKKLLRILGPGFISGASDDDPSGIATYSQTGAQFGFVQLWVALFSFPFMVVIQEMCGRIGMISAEGLSGVIKQHYSKKILYFAVTLLTIANVINIGADLGAMASTGQLLIGIPFIFWLVGIAILIVILEITVTYKIYAKFLKYMSLTLFAYIITALIIKVNWPKVLYSTLLPSFSTSKDYLLNIVAILGTTISPYLFFWQTNQEVEEGHKKNKLGLKAVGTAKDIPDIKNVDVRDMKIDTNVGMLFSNIIMFFIIVTTASTLKTHGITHIDTATQAAQALKPFAGSFASLLFAMGILGTGLLAVPVLAGSAAYAISEVFYWKEGLNKKIKRAPEFYGVIIVAVIIGVVLNFLPIKPFRMLYYTAIINGIAAPPLMVLIMLISNNKKIMGKYSNNTFSNIMGWIITGIMAIASIGLLLSLFF
ncbi:Nramp family divalent metal transporter [Lactovum miscens]|uniref:NRAMP (Natural resistance-associated macrophage protein)-like metal ion transporter n=1 Tax=Lactovum miscens TaxID=190387 RepID=A0A841C7M0_9LACT|nr:Nramp family divalent metal transporter [Lactovum miscens]MBB5887551.1 NRAMP (natural resistance-associated macrophage protein)-like metal ion transporter [Lactovum miscens]